MYTPDSELPDEAVMPFVTFSLAGIAYGISAAYVRLMLELPAVTPVPHAPAFVRGIISLRGRTVPLIDLRRRLDLATPPTRRDAAVGLIDRPPVDQDEPRETVLILAIDGATCAVAVDAVTAVEEIPDADLMPNPVESRPGDRTDPVVAVGRRSGAGGVVQILDPRRVCRLDAQARRKSQPN